MAGSPLSSQKTMHACVLKWGKPQDATPQRSNPQKVTATDCWTRCPELFSVSNESKRQIKSASELRPRRTTFRASLSFLRPRVLWPTPYKMTNLRRTRVEHIVFQNILSVFQASQSAGFGGNSNSIVPPNVKWPWVKIGFDPQPAK